MPIQNFYDGGSIETRPPNDVGITQEIGEEEGASKYAYVRYRIANKRLSAMESQLVEHEITINKYAISLQNETHLREMYQKALCEEQAMHVVCRAAYLRLLKSSNVHHACDEQVPRAYKAQHEQLLMQVTRLQQKIRKMTDQHSSALCIAADRIARNESALSLLQAQESESMHPANDKM